MAKKFKSPTLDPDKNHDEGDFIRILVHLSDFEAIGDDDVDALIASIAGVVSE